MSETMKGVGVLIKPASGSCNMHCDYCFYCDEAAKRRTASYGLMSVDTLRNVIKRTLMRAEKEYSIAFQGGEPTLCGIDFFRSAVEFLNKYNKNHAQIRIALQTNGYGIDEEWAQLFAEHHFLVGLSVDGIEEIHDRYRHGNDGGSSWAHVQRAAELFDRYGADYNILTVVHRETAERIREIYPAYRARGWNYLQFITCLDPIGEKRGQKDYSLLPRTYGQFLTELYDLWYAELLSGRQPYIRQFENYIGILLGYPPESCEQRGFCDLQNVIEADGSVYPCDFYVLDEFCLGNLNTDLLPEIYARRKDLSFVTRSRIIPEECRICPYFRLCRNGCYRSRLTREGEDGRNYFCEGYRMFFDARMAQLEAAAEIYRKHMGDRV